MRCPKCSRPMEGTKFDDVQVDRCTHCRGLWFDPGELERLQEVPAAKALDDGDPRLGQELNEAEADDCPRCHGRMIVMAHKEKPVRYEHCPVCGGSFLDAGEFSVLAKSSLAELVKGFF